MVFRRVNSTSVVERRVNDRDSRDCATSLLFDNCPLLLRMGKITYKRSFAIAIRTVMLIITNVYTGLCAKVIRPDRS